MSKADDNGHSMEAVRVQMLTVTFDPRNYRVEISGNVPTWEFGKAMLQMAVDETERKIAESRLQKRIEVATADVLPFLVGQKG